MSLIVTKLPRFVLHLILPFHHKGKVIKFVKLPAEFLLLPQIIHFPSKNEKTYTSLSDNFSFYDLAIPHVTTQLYQLYGLCVSYFSFPFTFPAVIWKKILKGTEDQCFSVIKRFVQRQGNCRSSQELSFQKVYLGGDIGVKIITLELQDKNLQVTVQTAEDVYI